MRQGQKELRQEHREMRQDANEIQRVFRRMDINWARFLGQAYKCHVRYRLAYRCVGAFGMENPAVAFSALDGPTPQFNSMIARALRSNAITQEQNVNLSDVDFIISADNNSHAVVEATVTAEDQDIIRAAERAGILSQATGGAARAVVVADTIPDRQLNLAGAMDVTIFRIEF